MKIRNVKTGKIENWAEEKFIDYIKKNSEDIIPNLTWIEIWDEEIEPKGEFSIRVKKFKIEAAFTTYGYADIYALDENDARQEALNLEGDDFVEDENVGGWDITNAMEK